MNILILNPESRVIHSEGILLKIPQLHGILPGQTPTGTVIKRTVMEDAEGILRFNWSFLILETADQLENSTNWWTMMKCFHSYEAENFGWDRINGCILKLQGAENEEVWVNLLCNCDTFPSISQDPSSFCKHAMYWEIDLQQKGPEELIFFVLQCDRTRLIRTELYCYVLFGRWDCFNWQTLFILQLQSQYIDFLYTKSS